MSTLRRGTIKAYDAGTHEATVQIAGSLSVWLDAIPVSSGIPAAEVDAGDECAVLFFSDDNPGDAVIIAVYPGVPIAPGGGGTIIQDADADTRVDTEASADEDKIRLTAGGTLRYLIQTTSIHHQLTGDASISGALNVGSGTLVPSTEYSRVGNPNTGVDGKAGLIVDMGGATSPSSSGAVSGVMGRAVTRDASGAGGSAIGLDYLAGANGQSIAGASAIKALIVAIGSGKTVTDARGLHIQTPTTVLATITNNYGIQIDNLTTGTNRRAIKTGDITGGTIARLIELGSTPDFMVKGTGELARAANQTLAFLAEGSPATVRQVQWKDGASVGAGDRVMVLV